MFFIYIDRNSVHRTLYIYTHAIETTNRFQFDFYASKYTCGFIAWARNILENFQPNNVDLSEC